MVELREVSCKWDIGKELLRKGEYKKAERIFREYIYFDPRDRDAWEKLSECYFGLYLKHKELYQKHKNPKYLKCAINFLEAATESLKHAMEDLLKEMELLIGDKF